VEGGTTEWWGGSKSIRVKIAKARAHCIDPQFCPLQENQGFFATHFFTKMKNFWRISAIFQFCKLPRNCRKKTLVFL
jgi:hypothetical protein